MSSEFRDMGAGDDNQKESGVQHDALVGLADYARRARAVLNSEVWDFIAGGADDEMTLRANLRSFRRLSFRPHVLVGVADRSSSTEVLGCAIEAPIIIAPMAYHRLANPAGEIATARAAAAERLPLTVSVFSSTAMEDVAKASDGPLWFQTYPFRDRSLTADLVQRAHAAGYQALVLTVDSPVMGHRERDVRNLFKIPPQVSAANLPAVPRAVKDLPPGESAVSELTSRLVDPDLRWDDLPWYGSLTPLPLIVKGILTGEDAARAAEHGAAAIIVSNHGGRQLDGAVASLNALPEVVEAVAGRCEVLLDGGVRRGTDVMKAIALGAKAVLVGRPVMWGLAVGGESGVGEVLRLLKTELDVAMALCGCRTIAEIEPGLVRHVPPSHGSK